MLKAGKIAEAADNIHDANRVINAADSLNDSRKVVESSKNVEKGVGNSVNVLGRGSTGRSVAHSLDEQLAMKEVMSNPLANAFEIPITMTDPRWLGTDGWVKMQRIITLSDGTKINIHYVYNKITDQFDDFKFK